MHRPVPNRLYMILALLGLATLTAPAHGGLYEWTDEDGRTHYSNAPRPGARRVGLAPIALEEEGSPNDTPTDEVRRDRLNRQRAERLVDSHEIAPAEGMSSAPAAPAQATRPTPPATQPGPAGPDLRVERSVAPMPTE